MKRNILCLSLLLTATTMMGASRTEKELRAIAASKLQQAASVKGVNPVASRSADLRLVADEAAYAVYTPASGEGFAIVAKSNIADPILGYSTTGTFDPADMPDGLQWFLNSMSKQMEEAEAKGDARLAPRHAAATYTPVEKFITTQWSQEYPFNKSTPNSYPAGCVATALAQCLNYCQWPASAEFEGTYYVTTVSGKTENTTSEKATVSTTYTWPYKDTYKSIGRTGDNIDELLRDCGYATYMQYTASGSGTMSFCAGMALTNFFGYPEESVKYMHYGYMQDPVAWAQLIYDELAVRSPVFYGSDDESFGGHAFLFSGVDDEGLVYVNWGWRGTADGFYNITALTPTQGGQTMNFDGTPEIVYGIRPQPLDTDHITGRIFGYSGYPYTCRFGTEKDDEGVDHVTLYCDLPYGFANFNSSSFQGVFGLFAKDLTDDTEWVITEDLQDRDTIPAGYGYYGSTDNYKTFYFYYFVDGEQGLKPGHTYRMSFGVKDDREGLWHSILCVNGELGYDITYTGDAATSTIDSERKPVPETTGVQTIPASSLSSPSGNLTRVYDTSGRLVFSSPTPQFNLWDVPARGILLVKQGGKTRKMVR